ncbi:MAG: hypothetical protein WBN43_22555, partial [Thiogranum sp.]
MGRKRAEEDFNYQWLKRYYLRSMRGQWQERYNRGVEKGSHPMGGPYLAIDECDYAVRVDDELVLYEYIRDNATGDEWNRIRSAWRQYR